MTELSSPKDQFDAGAFQVYHPANEWWHDQDLGHVPDVAYYSLARRFGDKTHTVAMDLESTSARFLNDQIQEERSNANLLAIGGVVLDDTYRSLATYHELSIEYVRWFASIAPGAIQVANQVLSKPEDKIALSVFGSISQHGIWESAGRLDSIARKFKADAEADASIDIKVPRTHAETPLKYLFAPDLRLMGPGGRDITSEEQAHIIEEVLRNPESDFVQPNYRLRLAQIERWRGVADIGIPQSRDAVRLFKRSVANVYLDGTDVSENVRNLSRLILPGMFAKDKGLVQRSTDRLSHFFGAIFEESIAHKNILSDTVVPSNCGYVMMYSTKNRP